MKTGTRRIRMMAMLSVIFLTALSCRLYYIQMICGSELSAGALRQQTVAIRTENSRGTIYDRNMIRLTDSCLSYYYLIEKEQYNERLEALLQKIGGELAGAKGEDWLVFKSEIYDRKISQKLSEEYGAYAFCSGNRYSDRQTAAHLIGYLRDSGRTGASGLEKMYQNRLSSGVSGLYLMGNGIGQPVRGIGVREKAEKNRISPSALITTIDAGLQREVERILADSGFYGAAVVLQPATGQVLAMASTPGFNPNKIDAYLQSDRGELVNKAVQGQYPPGSVFKIAVAAAALESGLVDPESVYTCTGSTEVNGVTLICDDHPEGHGQVNLEQAFACSCNGYFAKAAEKIGAETIVEMAHRLGLGEPVIEGFPDEERGSFPDQEDRCGSGLSNFAVGQGDLLATPVQIACMTNIIASGGVRFPVSVTAENTGTSKQGHRVITETTALQLQNMMEKVVTEGTASGAELPVSAAGKTGSAESGDHGQYTVHGWFTGYFPAENPQYTVTVLSENGKTGSHSALPVFEEIVRVLY